MTEIAPLPSMYVDENTPTDDIRARCRQAVARRDALHRAGAGIDHDTKMACQVLLSALRSRGQFSAPVTR